MDEKIMACRHLAQFFQVSIKYSLEPIDFIIKSLQSEYKEGIENYQPQWYSQSQYYYFEEFLEDNEVNIKVYEEYEIDYEEERMYWIGYCLQTWSNNIGISGKKTAEILGKKGIKHLLDNYNIYHTVDPMYVHEDAEDYLQIKII